MAGRREGELFSFCIQPLLFPFQNLSCHAHNAQMSLVNGRKDLCSEMAGWLDGWLSVSVVTGYRSLNPPSLKWW